MCCALRAGVAPSVLLLGRRSAPARGGAGGPSERWPSATAAHTGLSRGVPAHGLSPGGARRRRGSVAGTALSTQRWWAWRSAGLEGPVPALLRCLPRPRPAQQGFCRQGPPSVHHLPGDSESKRSVVSVRRWTSLFGTCGDCCDCAATGREGSPSVEARAGPHTLPRDSRQPWHRRRPILDGRTRGQDNNRACKASPEQGTTCSSERHHGAPGARRRLLGPQQLQERHRMVGAAGAVWPRGRRARRGGEPPHSRFKSIAGLGRTPQACAPARPGWPHGGVHARLTASLAMCPAAAARRDVPGLGRGPSVGGWWRCGGPRSAAGPPCAHRHRRAPTRAAASTSSTWARRATRWGLHARMGRMPDPLLPPACPASVVGEDLASWMGPDCEPCMPSPLPPPACPSPPRADEAAAGLLLGEARGDLAVPGVYRHLQGGPAGAVLGRLGVGVGSACCTPHPACSRGGQESWQGLLPSAIRGLLLRALARAARRHPAATGRC